MIRKKEDITEKILPVLKQYDVKRAGLFGSVVREEDTSKSDLDILIEFNGKKSLLDLARLKISLEDLLKIKIDVVTYNSLHRLLRDRILKEQKVIL
ncbi:nucleotidyltransferase family protein [Chlamydiota bacterium]